MSMQLSARQAALETLERLRRDKAWSGAGLDSAITKYGLDRRDAALTSQLCLGVLENDKLLDFYIGAFCKGKLEPKVRDILRLGAYQLVFLDRIPARAAVSESVTLCRDNGYFRAAGLVNAVLRRIASEAGGLPEVQGKGSAEYLSVRYSHPLWLCEYLTERKGYAFTEAFLAANNRPSALTIQVNTLKVSAADYCRALDRAGISYTASDSPEGSVTLPGGSAVELPGFEDGLFYVQDRAARMSVLASEPQPGMKVLDACASPGGKSFAAAIAMKNSGSILACDIHEKKLNLIRTGAARLGTDIISERAMDARAYDASLDSRFDIVIADVPCSGLGVIGKKPEIRAKDADEIAGLPAVQRAIIDNLSRYVRPGGLLMYSTCTVLNEENEAVVGAFLSSHGDFAAESFAVGGAAAESGMRCFWPNTDGTDGFFTAKLRRKGP